MGRKSKHLLWYRGPAIITRKLSNSTFELEFEGRKYYRCFSELRSYKSKKLPLDLPIAQNQQMQEHKLALGNYVALTDEDSQDNRGNTRYYLCRVVEFKDGNAVLLNYTTWSPKETTAVFNILYADMKGKYTTKRPARNPREHEVTDTIPLDEVDDLIGHYDIRLTRSRRLTSKSLRQLRQLKLVHHVLGKTYP